MERPEDAGNLKEGTYIVIDHEPYKIVEIEKSKTGKHGSAKVRIVATALYGDSKKSLVAPASQKINVPIIEKKAGQVINILPDSIQLMDLESYSTFELNKPKESEILEKLRAGVEVEYWIVLDKKRIVRVK